jgi:hypothetical protein
MRVVPDWWSGLVKTTRTLAFPSESDAIWVQTESTSGAITSSWSAIAWPPNIVAPLDELGAELGAAAGTAVMVVFFFFAMVLL